MAHANFSVPLILHSHEEFIAMGVRCRIDVMGTNAPFLVQQGINRVKQLEMLWSRFISSSDISRINNANGRPVSIDPATATLIEMMRAASRATEGAFNPTRLPEQIALGDSQSLTSPLSAVIPESARPYTCLDDVVATDGVTVHSPRDLTLDAGGIGKGLAADMVCEQVLHDGAHSVCINLGGDIRVANSPSSTHDWAIDVMSSIHEHRPVATISLRNGAIATSDSTARLRSNSGIAHHVQGADTTVRSVSVIASCAAWAEAWTKFLMAQPHKLEGLTTLGLAGCIAYENGKVRMSTLWKDFEQC